MNLLTVCRYFEKKTFNPRSSFDGVGNSAPLVSPLLMMTYSAITISVMKKSYAWKCDVTEKLDPFEKYRIVEI